MSAVKQQHTPRQCGIVKQARALNRQWVAHKMCGEYQFSHLRDRRDGLMRIARTKWAALAKVQP